MRPVIQPLPAAFGAFGLLWGAWQAALPDLAAHHGLSSGPLGLILTAGFAASLPVMLATGRFIDRFGSRAGIIVTAVGLAVGLGTVGLLGPLPLLVIGVVVMAAASGAFDVAINGAALGHERWGRPASLTLLHAAFSGGGLVGAVGAGTAIGAGLSFRLVYPVIGVMLLAAALTSLMERQESVQATGPIPRSVALALLPLAALAGLAFLVEGSMETWSAIYLRDGLGAAAFIGALGPAAFHAAMLIGRLIGAGVTGRLGPAPTLLVAGGVIAGGMIVALAVPVVPIAIGAMFGAALGASLVVPVVVSMAGRRAGGFAGRASSYVLSLGYAGFLVGPSIVGLVGEVAGLRAGLAVIPVAALVIVLMSRGRAVRA